MLISQEQGYQAEFLKHLGKNEKVENPNGKLAVKLQIMKVGYEEEENEEAVDEEKSPSKNAEYDAWELMLKIMTNKDHN